MEEHKTTDRFAAARAAIECRLAQVIEEKTTLESALAALVSLERQAVEIAARYSNAPTSPATNDAPATPRPSNPKKPVRLSPDQVSPTRKRRAHGPHAAYSPADDQRIMAAAQGRANAAQRFGSLARDMGRTVGGIERHYQELVKRSNPKRPVPTEVVAVSDPAYQPDRFRTVELPEAAKTEKRCERCAGRPEGCFDDGLCMYVGDEPQAAPDQLGSENTTIVEASQIEEVGEPIEPAPWGPPPLDEFDEAAASSEIVKAARAQEATTHRRPSEAPYSWPDITKAHARVDPATIGRSITGATVDNGPNDRRVYDNPDAYTSKNSD